MSSMPYTSTTNQTRRFSMPLFSSSSTLLPNHSNTLFKTQHNDNLSRMQNPNRFLFQIDSNRISKTLQNAITTTTSLSPHKPFLALVKNMKMNSKSNNEKRQKLKFLYEQQINTSFNEMSQKKEIDKTNCNRNHEKEKDEEGYFSSGDTLMPKIHFFIKGHFFRPFHCYLKVLSHMGPISSIY